MASKGSGCSKSGKAYEQTVHNITQKCNINSRKFNTQTEKELGGCNSGNDLSCNYKKEKDIGIEIKKNNTPDWMQYSIIYDDEKKRWVGSSRCKIPEKSKKIFEKLLTDVNLFDGKIPPFITENITYDEWTKIKKNTKSFNDVYIDCPDDTIKKLYSYKDCQYIQISNKGLYHLGRDKCKFDVPEFICDQQIRIRIKVHTRKNKNGYCNLSITAACKPKNIKNLENSQYSLDNVDKLPPKLIYSK